MRANEDILIYRLGSNFGAVSETAETITIALIRDATVCPTTSSF